MEAWYAHGCHITSRLMITQLPAWCDQVTEEKTVVLATRTGPVVKLDDKFYKLVDKMDALTLAPPSLKEAKSLTVKGPVKFEKGVVIKGDVLVVNGERLEPSLHGFQLARQQARGCDISISEPWGQHDNLQQCFVQSHQIQWH